MVDGDFGVNVTNKATCTNLGISSWENCPFWLQMVDTHSVCPLGLLRKLSIIIGGHLFEISAVLEAPGAYPLLLGRPWLRSANIKQNWQHNHLSFHRGRAKVRVPMQESTPAPNEISQLYAEEIHMLEGLEGLEDEELERYLGENPRIVPLFEIDVGETAESYSSPIKTTTDGDEPGENAIAELRRAQEAFEREIEISRWVAATELKEINMGTTDVFA